MKRSIVTTLSLAGLLAAGTVTGVVAQTSSTGAPDGQTAGRQWKHDGHGRRGMRGGHGMFGRQLGLTDEQKTQIQALRQAEQEKHATLRQQLQENHLAMREATKGGAFDEAQVRAIAEKNAAIQVELTVSRARLHSTIYNTVLTAEQRAKVDEMATKRADRAGKRRGF